MKFLASTQRKILSSLVAGTLVFAFILAPISSSLELKKAEAADANTAFQAAQLAKEALSAIYDGITSGAVASLATKEYVLDSIAWSLTNLVLQEMIRSTTQWVNSGFQGSPAFVTNLEGFLIDIADQVAGEFIWGSELSALCSPFKLDIQIALDIQYQRTRSGDSSVTAQCRLSDVIENMENFTEGDFIEGGWDGWYALTLTPENNPYGAFLEAQSELAASISNAQGEETKLLEFGRGFLSFKDANGNIATPGVVIEEQLNSVLQIPQGRLEVADELNELLGALFTQLVGTVFGGGGGLRGLSTAQANGTNYFGAVATEPATLGFSDTSNAALSGALTTERQHLSLQQTIVGLITGASTYKTRVYGNTQQCGAGTLSASLRNQLTTAQNAVTNTNTNIARINVFISDYQTLRSTTASNATKQAIVTKYGASTIPMAETLLMQQFSTYQSTGVLHTPVQNVSTELEVIPAVQAEVSAFTTSIDTACRQNGNGFGGVGGILGF